MTLTTYTGQMVAVPLFLSLIAPQSDADIRLKAIDALQEKRPDASTDIMKWVEECYTMADERGKLILDFYKTYPNHARTPKLLGTRWEDYIGHVRVPKMPRLDMIRDDVQNFLKLNPKGVNLEVAKTYETKEILLREWRTALDAKTKLNEPAGLPHLKKSKDACLKFQKAFPKVAEGVYNFYTYSEMTVGTPLEREAIGYLAKFYPESHLGRGAKGKLRRLDSVGKPFQISFKDFTTGKQIDMSQYKGKVVLIDFWASWCGPCRNDIEKEMLAMYKELKPQGFEVIGVSGDVPGDEGKKMLGDYVAAQGINWPNLWDGKGPQDGFALSWGISAWPTQFLVDRKGILRYTTRPEDRRKTIEALLAEK